MCLNIINQSVSKINKNIEICVKTIYYKCGDNMNNILDYLKWRNDLTFEKDSFNEIDSLILSRLSYFRWELIFDNENECTIENAYNKFALLNQEKIHVLAKEDPDLFQLLAYSHRFKDCIVSDFVNLIDENDVIQFSAITIHLNSNLHYISFRGTDNTIVGWKEDLYMSFQSNIPAHKEALNYLRNIAKKYKGKLYIGGHSKGGNLAMFASLFSSKIIQKRIFKVDNFDGPGLAQNLHDKVQFTDLYKRVQIYCPQNSIFGRMLYYEDSRRTLIFSNGHGVYQHDVYTWDVLGNQFIYASKFEKESEIIDNALKEFLDKVSPNQRKETIDIIFDVLESTNEDTFKQLSSNWLKNSTQVVKYISKIEPEHRKIVLDSVKTLFSIMFDEVKTVFIKEE